MKNLEKYQSYAKGKLFSRLDTNYLKWKNRLTVFGLIFLIFSAAGPQIGTRVSPVERKV